MKNSRWLEDRGLCPGSQDIAPGHYIPGSIKQDYSNVAVTCVQCKRALKGRVVTGGCTMGRYGNLIVPNHKPPKGWVWRCPSCLSQEGRTHTPEVCAARQRRLAVDVPRERDMPFIDPGYRQYDGEEYDRFDTRSR